MVRGFLHMAALAAAVALLCPPPARACHNGIIYELDDDVRVIVRAEQLVAGGRDDRALRAASRAVARMRRAGGRAAQDHIRRAQRVMAVAVVRVGGKVDLGRYRVVSWTSEPQRLSNLRWARDLLAGLRGGGGDPVLDARYAEALSRFDDQRDEALTILRGLATEDLMPDAWGYRALWDLERAGGDRTAAASALAECRARAGRLAGSICAP